MNSSNMATDESVTATSVKQLDHYIPSLWPVDSSRSNSHQDSLDLQSGGNVGLSLHAPVYDINSFYSMSGFKSDTTSNSDGDLGTSSSMEQGMSGADQMMFDAHHSFNNHHHHQEEDPHTPLQRTNTSLPCVDFHRWFREKDSMQGVSRTQFSNSPQQDYSSFSTNGQYHNNINNPFQSSSPFLQKSVTRALTQPLWQRRLTADNCPSLNVNGNLRLRLPKSQHRNSMSSGDHRAKLDSNSFYFDSSLSIRNKETKPSLSSFDSQQPFTHKAWNSKAEATLAFDPAVFSSFSSLKKKGKSSSTTSTLEHLSRSSSAAESSMNFYNQTSMNPLIVNASFSTSPLSIVPSSSEMSSRLYSQEVGEEAEFDSDEEEARHNDDGSSISQLSKVQSSRNKQSPNSSTPANVEWRNNESPVTLASPLMKFGGDFKGPISRIFVSKECQIDIDNLEYKGAGGNVETRHVCPLEGCNKHFSTSGHARRHSRIHAQLRPFKCPHISCGATFTRRDNCTQHQRARHHSQLMAHRISDDVQEKKRK